MALELGGLPEQFITRTCISRKYSPMRVFPLYSRMRIQIGPTAVALGVRHTVPLVVLTVGGAVAGRGLEPLQPPLQVLL